MFVVSEEKISVLLLLEPLGAIVRSVEEEEAVVEASETTLIGS